MKPGPFTLERARRLQNELHAGFSTKPFREKLKALMEAHPSRSGRQFTQERQALFLTVQKDVLPKYGFEGSQKGILEMMSAFGPHNSDPEVIRMASQIDDLLKV